MIKLNEFADLVFQTFPEFDSLWRDDEDASELPYMPCSDFVTYTIERTDAGDSAMLKKIFDFIEMLATEGDGETYNLVGVGFMERLFFKRDRADLASKLSPYFGETTREIYKDFYDYWLKNGLMKKPKLRVIWRKKRKNK